LKPDLYALPGAAPVPHIYAHDAIVLALDSGKKSMPELVEITGKNRAELWAALRRRLFPDGIAKRAGFRSGHDVRPGFRGRVAVLALTAKGRGRIRALGTGTSNLARHSSIDGSSARRYGSLRSASSANQRQIEGKSTQIGRARAA
jgi:hypothetical protein